MTSRGDSSNKYKATDFQESFQLSDRPPAPEVQDDESEEDVNPDSDAALLRRHRSDDEGESDNKIQNKVTRQGLLKRFLAFMSQAPLLRGSSASQATTSYGALPRRGPGSTQAMPQSDISDEDGENIKGKHSTVRSEASFPDIGSNRRRDGRESHSRTRSRRASLQGSSPILIAEPSHPAGQGGHLGGDLPIATSEDEDVTEEEAISIAEDDEPPDNSPYAQVRASVAATDDTSASINTPRMWTLSLLCALLGSATNLFFSLRYPSVAITPVIALVIVHPLGRLWDRLFKRNGDLVETFQDGDLANRNKPDHILSRRTRFRLWLAQGKWNGKEHACVYISSNVSFGFAFATDVIVEQSKFYHQDPSIIYQLLLTISTQILGYSFAGLTRRYLVRPPSMIWPGTLMSTAMFTTMHSSENKSANGWIISRWKFFIFAWSAAFAWYFLPGLLMPALSYFSVITWFAPKNVVVANLVNPSVL